MGKKTSARASASKSPAGSAGAVPASSVAGGRRGQGGKGGEHSARMLALLWGTHGKPGRSGLTVRAIVAAAIELADREGLEAVSMRHIADALNVGTMSLYTHIPGKEVLTALMLDTVCGRLYADVDEPVRQEGGWRAAVRFVAARNWALYQRHPWLLELIGGRPVLGPNVTLKYEAELRPLDGLGLSEVEMDSVLTLVLTHIEGTARAKAGVRRARDESGLTDVEWWVATAPLLDKVMDATRFPVAARVGQAAGEAYQGAADPEHAFRFGLDRIIEAVALLIAGKSS